LKRWRFREQLIRLGWGLGRTAAIVAAVLALACLADWTIDRYSGSQTWRDLLKSSWIFSAVDPLSAGETPLWVRYLMTLAQVVLAGTLVYFLAVRPWRRTPPIDDLASQAEKAFPAFDHRLVTAIQLNRATARTQGMSKVLIAEVTQEAEQLAAKHDMRSLIDYRRLAWAAAVIAPVALCWLAFAAINLNLATILVKRQALMGDEIPRKVHLKNVTQEVWPTGAEVVVRYEVTGQFYPEQVGVLRIAPEGQPEEFYDLVHEKPAGENAAYFSTRLPASSRDFSFQARLGDGRTREAGRVIFEAPPQLAPDDDAHPPLSATQVLPTYLGLAPDGTPYTRRTDSSRRGEIIDALPRSSVLLDARFNKPIHKARLIPIERGEGIRERELPPLDPIEVGADRLTAAWGFATTPKMIGYRIELEDDRGFVNPLPIRRSIRMWEDRPPSVEFLKESTRNPDPEQPDGKGAPSDYVWDMAIGPQGRVMVIYQARSDLGVREANIRYRVIPKGVQFDQYPDWYRAIQHPREDPGYRVYFQQKLLPAPDPVANKLGEFMPDLGLFRFSFRNVLKQDRPKVDAGFYSFPSPNPSSEPGGLIAGGRRNFEVAQLDKLVPDESAPNGTRLAKLEVGDTVELYVEVFDKLTGPDGKPVPGRPAGYTREAKRKIILTESDAAIAIYQRDEEKQKRTEQVQKLINDQIEVSRPKK
jgi:hypothetical protein